VARCEFAFSDIAAECEVVSGVHHLDGRDLGLRIHVPQALQGRFPFNCSAYDFLQFLRPQIHQYGLIEFLGLPLNPSNYTLAQRAPQQHGYSSNPYMTDRCQSPHQDTPPYPTAFWLAEPRRFFATWVMSTRGLQNFLSAQRQTPAAEIEALHRRLVPQSLRDDTGLLLNQSPGLLLIDNSPHHALYHARTCDFVAQAQTPDFAEDAPMYAFNEVGLLNYMDALDSRRGAAHRDARETAHVREFMEAERMAGN
jgi:hypothetical protein